MKGDVRKIDATKETLSQIEKGSVGFMKISLSTPPTTSAIGTARKWKISSRRVQQMQKATTIPTTLCRMRFRSSSRCSRNVILALWSRPSSSSGVSSGSLPSPGWWHRRDDGGGRFQGCLLVVFSILGQSRGFRVILRGAVGGGVTRMIAHNQLLKRLGNRS